MTPEILYEDNHVIVAVKPANMPVQEDESGDADMLSVLKDYIKVKYEKPGNVFLGLCHRLDRPVGGVMVFARTSKAASRLTEQFAKKAARKRYAAVVCGKSENRKRLDCFMRKDEKTFSSYVCAKNAPGAKSASLSYRRTAYKGGLSLLDIDLKTGRHHQIRVQLSGEGLPIYGDHRYNEAFFDDKNTNIALFAYSLEFEHPTLHETMRFFAVPKGGVWDSFSFELGCMAHGIVPAYADDNIIVCDKPAGLSVAIADGGDDTLECRLQTTADYALPVHRIDATTEGLVIFARNEAAYTELLRAFSAHDGTIVKHYTCTVIGEPKKKSAELIAYLVKDDEAGRVRIYDRQTPDSQEIITRYSIIRTYVKSGIRLSDLDIELVTGRTHQIRAHMARAGFPLIGDDKYGDREINKQLKVRTPALRSDTVTFNFRESSPLCYLNRIIIN